MILLERLLRGEVPSWSPGIVLALVSGIFVPLGGLIGAAWRPGRISKPLSRVLAVFSGALISVTMLDIFPSALRGVIAEGYDQRWSYGFCSVVILVSMIVIQLAKFTSDLPAVILERFKRAITQRRLEVDPSLRNSKGRMAADEFISSWMHFSCDQKNITITEVRSKRAEKARQLHRDDASGVFSPQMADLSKHNRESIQFIADSLFHFSDGDAPLVEILLKSAGREIVDMSSFNHAEFCSFVTYAVGPPQEKFAEPLWDELCTICSDAPTPGMLVELLEEPWEVLQQQRRPVDIAGMKPSILSVRKEAHAYYGAHAGPGLNRLLNLALSGSVNSKRAEAETNQPSTQQSWHARIEQFKTMEGIIDKRLIPLLRVLCEHFAAFLAHIFPGILMFHISKVDLKTATDLACLMLLRNVPEGLLLIVDAMEAMEGSRSQKRCQRCKDILGSLMIGLSEGLGACLAYYVMDVTFDPLVYVGIYLCVGGSFIYLSVIKFMSCSSRYHPDLEIPTFAFASGAVMAGFALTVLDAGPMRSTPIARGPRSRGGGGGG